MEKLIKEWIMSLSPEDREKYFMLAVADIMAETTMSLDEVQPHLNRDGVRNLAALEETFELESSEEEREEPAES